eukprot:7169771-Pyramimonas_sp.AAC.1
MRRIGWSAVSPTIWRSSLGTDVDISSTSPREVVALVIRGASVWASKQASERHPSFSHLSGPLFPAPSSFPVV